MVLRYLQILAQAELPIAFRDGGEVKLIRGLAGSGWIVAEIRKASDGSTVAEVYRITANGYLVLRVLGQK